MEAKIVEGPAIANAMPAYKTSYDIQPHAGESGFDDSAWPAIDAKGLADRRGGGKVSFIWYRAKLTIPAKIGDFDTSGAMVVLTAYVDDYAEVWVNGQMPRRAGITSPATIQGFNIPNRVVLADSVKAGDTLSAIAKQTLGDPNAYMKIFEANRDQFADPNKIKPGQVLRLP